MSFDAIRKSKSPGSQRETRSHRGPASPTGHQQASLLPLIAQAEALLARNRTVSQATFHGLILGTVYLSAFAVRFDGSVPSRYHELALRTLPCVVGLQLAACFVMGAHRGNWRSASFIDLIHLAEATTIAALSVLILNVVVFHSEIPRSVVLIDWALLLLGLGILRGGGD